jgi:hypothetical protein
MHEIESQRVVNPSIIIVDSRNIIIDTAVDDNHLSMTEAATTDVAVVNAVESSQGEQQQQQQTLPPPPPPQRRQQEATNDADSDESEVVINDDVLPFLFFGGIVFLVGLMRAIGLM